MGILSIFKKKKEKSVESNFDEALEAVKAGRATKNVCLVYMALKSFNEDYRLTFHTIKEIKDRTPFMKDGTIVGCLTALRKKYIVDCIYVENNGVSTHAYRLSPDALQKDIDKLDKDLEYYLEQEEKERWKYKK